MAAVPATTAADIESLTHPVNDFQV